MIYLCYDYEKLIQNILENETKLLSYIKILQY